MAKGQQRGNREAKKPKAVKPKTPVVSSFTSSLAKAKPGNTPPAGKK